MSIQGSLPLLLRQNNDSKNARSSELIARPAYGKVLRQTIRELFAKKEKYIANAMVRSPGERCERHGAESEFFKVGRCRHCTKAVRRLLLEEVSRKQRK